MNPRNETAGTERDEITDPTAEGLNREQRRALRFGKHADHVQDNLLPESVNNPGSPSAGEAFTGSADEGVTSPTGPGTGGGTESDGRLVHHEGMHLGNEPNS